MTAPTQLATPQTARIDVHGNRVHIGTQVSVTPLGLLAIAGLVCGILLSVPPILRAASAAKAVGRHPCVHE